MCACACRTIRSAVFVNPPNFILLTSELGKCLCREKKKPQYAVHLLHVPRRRVYRVETRDGKEKSFTIRGINAQTDTGLCVYTYMRAHSTKYECGVRVCVCSPYYSVSVRRVRKREHTSIRLPVLRYNRVTVSFDDDTKTERTLSLVLQPCLFFIFTSQTDSCFSSR